MFKINPFIKIGRQEFPDTNKVVSGNAYPSDVQNTFPMQYPNYHMPFGQQGIMGYSECGQNNLSYRTNNSVDRVIVNLFFNQLLQNKDEIVRLWMQEDKKPFVKCIALILTQYLRLIVKHQRWLYAYNGKIYIMFDSVRSLEPMLRELGECISGIVSNFVCCSSFVRQLSAEIEQLCPVVEVPADIGRYIVFNNCIFDTATMRTMPFTPNLFITSMVCVDWNPSAVYSPVFDKLIMDYTQGDYILAQRLKEVLGVFLTNDIVKSIFCFEGITNSGKSFIVNYITGLLNAESVVSMAPDEFNGNFANVKVFNKSVCMCLDMPGTPLDAKATSMLKQISGGDMIGAEVKYQNGNVSFRSRAHLILGSNFDIVPAYGDMAFQARKVIVPFTHRITDENIQPDELQRMLEPEREAIVNKLIHAYIALKNNNYVFSGSGMWYDRYIPPTVTGMDNSGSIRAFFANCCESTGNEADYVFTEELYKAYCLYANMSNAYQYSCIESFAKDFKNFGCYISKERKRPGNGENPHYCYTGIKLK